MSAAVPRVPLPGGDPDRAERLAVVIPTKDRADSLRALLANLARQTQPPERILVIDASGHPSAAREAAAPWSARVEVLRHLPPSAAAQRNRGIRTLAGTAPLIALLDDDVLLAPEALARMRAFFASARADGVVGAGFNPRSATAPAAGWKRGWLAERLGLYPRRPGAVARSGWQAIFGRVGEDTAVDWLPSTAAVWRAELLDTIGGFDEFFVRYSYLEDLELSLRSRRQGRLVLVADALYDHCHGTAGKVGAMEFGLVEVRNRLYLVRKHGLSRWRCGLGLLVRAGITLGCALRWRDRQQWLRLVGNLRGLIEQVAGGPRALPGGSSRRRGPRSPPSAGPRW